LVALWENLQRDGTGVDDRLINRPDVFMTNFLMPGTLYVPWGRWGLGIAQALNPKGDCIVHFAIWDRTIEPYVIYTTAKNSLKWLFDTYELVRITAAIPEVNTGAIRLARLLCFQQEGIIRKGFLQRDRWYNIRLFGLLREEFQHATGSDDSDRDSSVGGV